MDQNYFLEFKEKTHLNRVQGKNSFENTRIKINEYLNRNESKLKV